MLSAMGYFTNFLSGVYWGYNPLILTIDPNKPNRTSKYVDAMGRGETLDLWIFCLAQPWIGVFQVARDRNNLHQQVLTGRWVDLGIPGFWAERRLKIRAESPDMLEDNLGYNFSLESVFYGKTP